MISTRTRSPRGFGARAATNLGVALLFIGAFTMLFPFIWMLLSSFKTRFEIMRFPITWLPDVWQFQNYTEVLTKYNFAAYYKNTLVVTLVNLAGEMVVNTLAAYAFARIEFPGSKAIFFLLLSVSMIPSQMTLIPVYIIMTRLGWVNTYLALTVPQFASVYGMFLCRQFFMTLPKALEEAAVIDGCSRFKIYYSIVMPLSKPVLIAYGIGCVLANWNDLLWPLLMTSTDRMRTLAVGIAAMRGQYAVMYHSMMAASCLSVAPLIILFLCAQKHFIKGLAVTGMKL